MRRPARLGKPGSPVTEQIHRIVAWQWQSRIEPSDGRQYYLGNTQEACMGTRVTSKGQVTIPAEIREAAQVAAGTELEWTYEPLGQRIVARKIGPRARRSGSRFAALRGSATVKMSTDEILALTRGDPEE
jgi:antitoxin PrlF